MVCRPSFKTLSVFLFLFSALKKLVDSFNNTTKLQQSKSRLKTLLKEIISISRRTKFTAQFDAKTVKYIPNIILCNSNEIEYITSNNPYDNTIQPVTHGYPNGHKTTKLQLHIIPSIVNKPTLCCLSCLISPKLVSNHTIHTLTLRAELCPLPG